MKQILFVLLAFSFAFAKAQDMTPTETSALLNLTLNCIEGGVFSNQEVIFTNVSDKTQIKAITGADGKAKVLLPINSSYEMQIKNFSEKRVISTPNAARITMNNTMN